MNCRRIQNRLLYLASPDKPPPRIRAHLAECAACREWQRQLLLLERNVPFLPVPPSRNRQAFLSQFRAAPIQTPMPMRQRANPANLPVLHPLLIPKAAVAAPSNPKPISLPRLSPTWGMRRSWTVAAGVAATLLLVCSGWGLLSSGDDASRSTRARIPLDPFLVNLIGCDLRLAEAATPRERVEALADLADGLQDEMQTMLPGAEAEDVQHLARLYDEVVRKGVMANAGALTAKERGLILEGIMQRLTRAAGAADNLAQKVPPASSAPLRLVADAARAGDSRLRELLLEHLP
jgi:hypothetical protein